MSNEWYYAVEGASNGPVSQEEFDGLVNVGTIRSDTLVWQEGMQDWLPYGRAGSAAAAQALPPRMAPENTQDPARSDANTFVGALKDAFARFEDGDLVIKNNLFWDVSEQGNSAQESDIFKISMGDGWSSGADSTDAINASTTAFQASFSSQNNQINDPGLSYSFAPAGVNIVPSVSITSSSVNDNWFTTVNYVGAFQSNGQNWAKEWTLIDGYQPGESNSDSYLQ